jgi:hypothetical protein
MTHTQLTPDSAAVWRSIGEYSADQAACLLLNIEPERSYFAHSGKGRALAVRIEQRFGIEDTGILTDPISLSSLEAFASEIGITDSLLFRPQPPEQPPPPEQPAKPRPGRPPDPDMLKAESHALALMLYHGLDETAAIAQAITEHYPNANWDTTQSKRKTLRRRLSDLRKRLGETPR